MARCNFRLMRFLGAGAALLVVSSSGLAQTFIGPTPYLSKNDSPFLTSINAGTTYLETFESGTLSTPGVTASAGAPFGPSAITDSVDADDGVIDGSGAAGHSFFSGNGAAGITFTFDATVLGHLPTQVGIVWTDGAGTTLFEAFGPGGVPLGQIGPVAIADGTFFGTTAEDRFFGVTNAAGISAIRISNTSGGIEVDHLQYGVFGAPPPVAGIPVPTLSETALMLLALLTAAFAWRVLSKRREI
jgi:IPTL-CTERM motif